MRAFKSSYQMRKLLYIGLLLLVSQYSKAQLGGRATYSFLDLVSNPRLAGLGGKATGFDEEDVAIGFWNASMMRKEMGGQWNISHINFPVGINSGEAVYAHHVDKIGTFHAGFRMLDYGSFEASDFNGFVNGTFRAADYALVLGGSTQLDSNWSVGAQLKIINSALEIYSSWGLATDFSATYRIPEKRFAVSAVFRNIGTQLTTYSGTREPLPFEVQLGISNKFEHMPFRWHITLDNLQQWDVSYFNPALRQIDPITGEPIDQNVSLGQMFLRHLIVGAEFQPTQGFQVQVGYNFRRQAEMKMLTRRSSAGLSFGVGIRLFKIRFNYARTNYHVSGATNHLGVGVDLNRFKKQKI